MGGIIVYDITDPLAVSFVDYVTTRDFAGDPESGTAGDLAPKDLAFVSREDRPTGEPLLLVGHEVSGTTAVFRVDRITVP